MCASFKWQREHDAEQWEHDGTSKWRTVKPGEKPDRFFTKGRIVLFSLAGLVLIGVGAGALVRIEDTVRAAGTVEPLEGQPIKAAIKAVVQDLLVREGDLVEAGAIIVKLWPQESSVVSDLQERRQEGERARTEVEKKTKEIEILEATGEKFSEERRLLEEDHSPIEGEQEKVELARIDSEQKKKDCGRIEELEKQGVASAEELERARAALEISQAEHDAASAELRSAQSERVRTLDRLARDIEIVDKRLGLARLELKQCRDEMRRIEERQRTAEERVKHATVTAPFSGRVVKIEKRRHDRVEPGDFILMLAASDAVGIRAEINPKDAPYVRLDQNVHVFSRFYSSRKHGVAEGHVTEKYTYARSTRADGSREVIPVYVAVDRNPFPSLPLGTTVDVHIVVGTRPILFHARKLEDDARSPSAEGSPS